MPWIDLRSEETLELARAKVARCGGLCAAAAQIGIAQPTLAKYLDGGKYSMWESTMRRLQAWLESPDPQEPKGPLPESVPDEELRAAARRLISKADSFAQAAREARVGQNCLRNFAFYGRPVQPANRRKLIRWAFPAMGETAGNGEAVRYEETEGGRQTMGFGAQACDGAPCHDQADSRCAANTETSESREIESPVCVAAWELSGDELRFAMAAEWEEWGRWCGLENRVPGGIDAIEAYLAGEDCDPRAVRALRLQMGFMEPAEEEDALRAAKAGTRRRRSAPRIARTPRPGSRRGRAGAA